MVFVDEIDVDKLVNILSLEVDAAIDGWISGYVLEEIAVMSRLIEMLARRRRGCNIGKTESIRVRAEVYLLHRKEDDASDKSGSDLAVTVYADKNDFAKTCLLQLKTVDSAKVILERNQLESAMSIPLIRERSFVMSVDKNDKMVKIGQFSNLYDFFNATQDKKTFYNSDWADLNQWTREWLACNVGKPSRMNDPHSVERLLENFVVKENDRSNPQNVDMFEIPNDFIPARAWLRLYFESRKSQNKK